MGETSTVLATTLASIILLMFLLWLASLALKDASIVDSFWVVLLEKSLVKTKPEYQDYVRRTSAFFPWIPGR